MRTSKIACSNQYHSFITADTAFPVSGGAEDSVVDTQTDSILVEQPVLAHGFSVYFNYKPSLLSV
jgi:hypothetical protein